MVIPVLDTLDLTGKTITTDALLTQRKLAEYLLDHDAHYVFTVKDNPPTLLADIRLIFADRGQPDFREPPTLAHGRIEQRAIWTSTRLNDYLTRCRPWRAKRRPVVPGRRRCGRPAGVAKGQSPGAAQAGCKRIRHAVKPFDVGPWQSPTAPLGGTS